MFEVGDRVKALTQLSIPGQPDYVPAGTEGAVTEVTNPPYPITVEFDGVEVPWFVRIIEIERLDS